MQHIKTVVILQLVNLGYMFRPLPSHHQANKEMVLIKVYNGIPLVKANECTLINTISLLVWWWLGNGRNM